MVFSLIVYRKKIQETENKGYRNKDMADKEEKNVEFKAAKNEEGKKGAPVAAAVKKPHSKKNIAWWAGVIILILISITFVLPATGISSIFAQDSIVFGTYNGEKIEYKYGNYFYNQYANLANTYGADAANAYNIWYQAFYQTVLHTALSQMAEEAGVTATEKAINDYILLSGIYNGEDGNFSAETYEGTSSAIREQVYAAASADVPSQQVITDITSVVASDAEKDFVGTIAANGRSFTYVAFDSSSYPDADAIAYVNSNPQPFTSVNLSIISASDAATAQSALDSVISGEKTFEDAARESSTDNYRSAGGVMDDMMFFELEDILIGGEEAVNTIFNTAVGSYTEPLQSTYGYSVFRVDSAPAMADTSDVIVLARVKSEIAASQGELIRSYAETASADFYANLSDDFSAQVAAAGLVEQSVSSTPANPEASNIIGSFTYSDSYGLLATAATDDAYLTSLYTAEEGTVLAPQQAGNAYIITRVGEETTSDNLRTSIVSFYDYLNSQMLAPTDLQNSILTNDGFEDNFFTTLLSEVFASGSTS